MTSFDLLSLGLADDESVESARLINNQTATVVPEHRRAQFARAVVAFSQAGVKKTDKVELTLRSADEATEYRAQLVAYAAEHATTGGVHGLGISLYLPKFIDAHEVERTDKETGQVSKKLIPANNVPKGTNEGRNVTWRLTSKKPETPATAPAAPVTVTATAPKPAAPKPRGQQVINGGGPRSLTGRR